jgi:hypothetical protein
VTEELDPGLFGHHAQPQEMRDLRVRQFVELLRGAVGAAGTCGGRDEREARRPGNGRR